MSVSIGTVATTSPDKFRPIAIRFAISLRRGQTMTETSLLPCPFCQDGGDVRVNGKKAGCFRCGVVAPMETWNQRYERMCHIIEEDNLMDSEGRGDAWGRCSECSSIIVVFTDNNGLPIPKYCPDCGARIVEVDGIPEWDDDRWGDR